jgi:hypothetical protein
MVESAFGSWDLGLETVRLDGRRQVRMGIAWPAPKPVAAYVGLITRDSFEDLLQFEKPSGVGFSMSLTIADYNLRRPARVTAITLGDRMAIGGERLETRLLHPC